MNLRVKGWGEFQHYSKRNPPWIKLHKKLLDNYDFHCLPDASKALAPFLWLLASESDDGSILFEPRKIAFRLHMTEEHLQEAIKPLIEADFLECDDDASAMLAPCKQDATPETETETETEEETEEEEEKIHVAAAPCVISPTPMITADMSAEDLFWSMADQAAKAGITRSLMGKLANQADDFDEAYDTLRSAISAREPRRYLGAIIGKRKTEESAQAAAIAGLPSSEPAFVREARRDGLYVERMESGRWRVSGAIYDSGGNEVGW